MYWTKILQLLPAEGHDSPDSYVETAMRLFPRSDRSVLAASAQWLRIDAAGRWQPAFPADPAILTADPAEPSAGQTSRLRSATTGPVLVVHAELSELYDDDTFRDVAAEYRQGESAVLEKSGHNVMWENPNGLVEIIDKFLDTMYEAAGGADGLLRLAGAWHARVMADEVVSHAFSHGFHSDHTERLAAYWGEALGGPATYSEAYGDETSVVRIHSGNGPHDEMDDRAIACFDQALVDVGLSWRRPLRQVLHDYFAWATTTTMSRYQTPPTTYRTGCGSRVGRGTG